MATLLGREKQVRRNVDNARFARLSLLGRATSPVLVLFLKFAFGLHQVLQVATVKAATLDVDLVGALTDLFSSGPILS